MPESPRYVWFGPETTQKLRHALNAASDEAVVIVRGQGERMTVEVAEPDAKVGEEAGAGAVNEAHPCPPFCR